MSLLLALHLAGAPALALPPPVLGPDGPVMLGPLPPSAADPRGAVCVDPVDGALHLDLPGAAGPFAWDGQRWTLAGQPLRGPDEPDAEAPVPADAGRAVVAVGARWEWEGEALVALVDAEGGRVRLLSDERGRPRRVEWPDGTHLEVRYDAFGRVEQTEGPGGRRVSLAWRDGGVVQRDLRGAPLAIRPVPGVAEAARGIEVSDALGRVARTWLGPDERGGERVLGWDDPRGMQTWVERGEGGLTVRDGAGRSWSVELDEAGQVVAVSLPGGRRWAWRRNAAGRLAAIEDPAGRIHAWSEDRQGRVEAAGLGASPWRLRRDAAGRVVEIQDPVGASTRLERDPSGRVVAVEDPLGNTTRLERSGAGRVVRVDAPGEASWRIERDLLGRPARVADPAQGRVELRRDDSGRVAVLRAQEGGSFRLDRGADGQLNRIRAESGEALELRRDSGGRVSAVRRADGSELGIARDPLGEVVRLRVEGRTVVVERGADGAPTRAGAVSWRRDPAGSVVGVEAPGRALSLRLDGAGRIAGVEAAGWVLAVARDGAGRIVRWAGTDGTVAVRRSPAGRVLAEEVQLAGEGAGPAQLASALAPEPTEAGPTDAALLARWGQGAAPPPRVEADPLAVAAPAGAEAPDPLAAALSAPEPLAGGAAGAAGRVEASWDLAGHLQRIQLGGQQWRLSRDAAGRLLRLVGEGLGTVGMDRDPAGRIDLLRLPRGGLVRRAWAGLDSLLTLVGTDGRELDSWGRTVDAVGRWTADAPGTWGRRLWRRDPAGRLVLIETVDGQAWSWSPQARTGPDGVEVALDARGRPAEGRPPVGPPAWGVGAVTLSYAWDPAGALTMVAGELGAARVEHDGLGRLVGLDPEQGGAWRLGYDARGRVARVERGGAEVHHLRWGPDDGSGRAPLLASGPAGRDRWLWGDWGPAAVVTPAGTTELYPLPEARPWWFQGPTGQATLASVEPGGFPMVSRGEPSADLVAAGDALQLFPGGPLLARAPSEGGAVPAGAALDPLTGLRVDGARPWPWAQAELYEDGTGALLDPQPWAAASPFTRPLDLLVALGELAPPVAGDFLPVEATAPVLAGLPAGLEQTRPPLGPPLASLPLDEDAVTLAVIAAHLPGGAPLDRDAILRALLADELDLPWLPPGLEVPLPPTWLAPPGASGLPAAEN